MELFMQTLDKQTSPTTPLHFLRNALLLLLLFLLVPGAAFLMHLYDKEVEFKIRGTPPKIVEGPWGELHEWDIRLEQPVEYVGFDQTRPGLPNWNFNSMTELAVHDLLIACGISGSQVAGFLKCRLPDFGGSFVISPTEDLLLSLSPEVRARLYLELSKNQANKFQYTPYFLPLQSMDSLFATDGYNNHGEILSLIKKLSYQRNGFTYFSDPEIVMNHLSSEKECLAFLKSLSGVTVLITRLRVQRDSDLEKIANYWMLSMPGIRAKDIKPLLEAEKMLPEGGTLSLIYLLPQLAREKLFSTPLPSDGKSSVQPDCHWSALNFFSLTADPRMLDNTFASRYIIENYYQIAQPGIGGDLVLLLNSSNKVIHSSVYIADDFVFTKNGFNYAQPWVLMREKTMIGYFSALEPVKAVYFRRKNL